MPKFIAIASIVGVSILVISLLTSGPIQTGVAGLEVHQKVVVGDELRLLVSTFRHYRPPGSHSSKIADTKGYLITIDLASDKPLRDRAKIYGPLWDVPAPRSSVGFQTGAAFTKDDVDAANATPICLFDVDGSLLRFKTDPKTATTMRDILVITPTSATWKQQGKTNGIDDNLGFGSEDRALSPSGRFVILYQKGEAKLFDRFTGLQTDDPWLTQCFAQARSIKDLNNVSILLTEDLNHLVICPFAIWNDGTRHKIFETFEFDGKTHDRAATGLAYSRPVLPPKLFPRKMEEKEGLFWEVPRGAVSIKGELYLINDEATLRLVTPDGGKEIVARTDGQNVWPLHSASPIQHHGDELIMFGATSIEDAIANKTLTVVRWNYVKNKVARHDIRVRNLFEEDKGLLRPPSTTPVK